MGSGVLVSPDGYNITNAHVIDNALEDGKEVVITALPLYHIFALVINTLVMFKYGAKNILITNPRDMDGFVEELSKVLNYRLNPKYAPPREGEVSEIILDIRKATKILKWKPLFSFQDGIKNTVQELGLNKLL